jgi:adenine-specific DNA-methyltransferase
MQTLNYIGSKKTLFNNILEICRKNINNLEKRSFSDLFAGTGTVGYNMNNYCKSVISNDLEYYSYVINYALLKCKYTKKIKKIIENINNIESVDTGLVYKNFSENENCERMYFTNDNAKKCDAIRIYLNELSNKQEITNKEYYFLLASLLVSMDKVANTSSVYGAYLKKYKKSSLKNLLVKPIHINKKNNTRNKVYNKRMEKLIINKKLDIVYLDHPYNHRQYGSNYSLLNYIAYYKEELELTGKTGLIKDYNKSVFCSKTKIKDEFRKMINNLDCNYIILSYNNEGLLSFDELKEILITKGDIILYKIEYNKFKAQKNVKIKKVIEYIWFIDTKKNNNTYSEVFL